MSHADLISSLTENGGVHPSRKGRAASCIMQWQRDVWIVDVNLNESCWQRRRGNATGLNTTAWPAAPSKLGWGWEHCKILNGVQCMQQQATAASGKGKRCDFSFFFTMSSNANAGACGRRRLQCCQHYKYIRYTFKSSKNVKMHVIQFEGNIYFKFCYIWFW